MNSPAAPKPRSTPAAFEQLLRESFRVRDTPRHALLMGVNPEEIVRYVRGGLSPAERNELTTLLVRSDWAMNRVTALVKAARNPNSLGAQILRSDHIDPYAWGIKMTEDREYDLTVLLDRVDEHSQP